MMTVEQWYIQARYHNFKEVLTLKHTKVTLQVDAVPSLKLFVCLFYNVMRTLLVTTIHHNMVTTTIMR